MVERKGRFKITSSWQPHPRLVLRFTEVSMLCLWKSPATTKNNSKICAIIVVISEHPPPQLKNPVRVHTSIRFERRSDIVLDSVLCCLDIPCNPSPLWFGIARFSLHQPLASVSSVRVTSLRIRFCTTLTPPHILHP